MAPLSPARPQEAAGAPKAPSAAGCHCTPEGQVEVVEGFHVLVLHVKLLGEFQWIVLIREGSAGGPGWREVTGALSPPPRAPARLTLQVRRLRAGASGI